MLEPMVGELSATAARTLRDGGARLADGALGLAAEGGTLDAAPRVTTTDAAGRFAFPDVEEGAWLVTSSALDHRSGFARIAVEKPATTLAETTFVNIALTPTGTFTGTVTLQNATDHRGTFVYVLGPSNIAATDAAGRYVLRDVPLGAWSLTATHAGWLDTSTNGTLAAAGDSIELAAQQLKVQNNIAPTVTLTANPYGRSGAGHDFTATANDPDGTIVRYEWDWTDDGTFDLTGTSPTVSILSPSAEGIYRTKVRVTDDKGAIALAVINVDVYEAIHVALSGNDTNTGRRAAPKRTITAALAAAEAFPGGRIMVRAAAGLFIENLTLGSNQRLYGGYAYPAWTPTATKTSIQGWSVGVGLIDSEYDNLQFGGRDTTVPGESAIGLTLKDCIEEVYFYNCRFDGGFTAAAAAAAHAANGANGTNGTLGAGGNSITGQGGAGGPGGSLGGGNGGNGGFASGGSGSSGQAGAGALGGAGGASGGGAGGNGQNAPNGVNGAAPPVGPGSLSGTTFVARAGLPGTTNHGGGGGGGGGYNGTSIPSLPGSGGGGGGGGSEGGKPGPAGPGGGSSFGLLSVGDNGNVYFDNCSFWAYGAGNGGAGGNGALPGATAGQGAGQGGDGGIGGRSGGGSGGNGGWSFGAYSTGASEPSFDPSCTFPLDEQSAGTGGLGGLHGSGSPRAASGNNGLFGTRRYDP